MINAEAVRRGDAEIIENLLSEKVLDAAIEVHRTLGGPGLLESLYWCYLNVEKNSKQLYAGLIRKKQAPIMIGIVFLESKMLAAAMIFFSDSSRTSIYEDALFYELKLRNIPALSQVLIPVTYKNCKLRDPMRLDILVDRKVIIEVKATETVLAVHKAQVLTYLRLTNLKLGLVINFGQGRLIDGWNRVVNDL